MAGLNSYGVSVAFHAVIGVALWFVHVKPPEEAVAVQVQTFEREKPKPKPEPEPEPAAAPTPAPHKAAPTPEPTEAPPPAPDYGFQMGNSDAPGGIAVPPKPQPAPVQKVATAKKLGTVAAPQDTCSDPDTKPKPVSVTKPTETEAAIAAGIRGKVIVEIVISETGAVTDAKVIQGLGYGLDEVAIATARGWKFAPATHCGKPVASTFKVGLNFAPN